MVKTVLITGSSTGIGRAAAILFQKKGWNVIASMRNPDKETELLKHPNVFCARLDVTSAESVSEAIQKSIQRFGKIDVVVNNAGYGLTGPFEGVTEAQIYKQFETNVFGLMRVVRTVLPYFREQKSGTIINVSSIGGRIVFPYYSLYHASKWAVEGFTESLRFEVEPLGIKVRLVEPGPIKTDFYDRSGDSGLKTAPDDYQQLATLAMKNMDQEGDQGSPPEKVAEVIYRAATHPGYRLRFPAGKLAHPILLFRRFAPDGVFAKAVRGLVFRKTQ